MPQKPILYVIAGTNGTGKSSHFYAFIPLEISVINTDAIAKQLKEKAFSEAELYSIANEEGNKILQQNLAEHKSFGIETNLADNGSWKMLLYIKDRGYALQIFYFGIDDVNISIKRIAERVLRGEHHVPSNLVKERLLNSASLLIHYFTIPDLIVFIDNTISPQKTAVVKNGSITFKTKKLPDWIFENFSSVFVPAKKKPSSKKIADASSVEAVKLLYSKIKNKKL